MLSFSAIDVETANASGASICQIGLVQVRNGKITREWESLVNPQGSFHRGNIRVHGIRSEDVRHSPTLPRIWNTLRSSLRGSILVSHTNFDRRAFEQAQDRFGLEPLDVLWVDSTRIVRRSWPRRYARRGFGLDNVARDLGITFRHHDALEDARAAALIVLQACEASGTRIEDWLYP